MPSFATTLKREVRRIAAKEIKRALKALRRAQRQVRALRVVSRAQKRSLASVERRLGRLKARIASRHGFSLPSGRNGPRMSPTSIRNLRARLRMTRLQFAKLVGVSAGSIFGWESGRTIPRGRSLARVAEIRMKRAKAKGTQRTKRPSRRKRSPRRRGRRR